MSYTLDDDDPRIEAVAREWCSILHDDPDLKVRSVYLGGKHPCWQGYADLARRLLTAADLVEVRRLEEARQQELSPVPGKLVGFIRRNGLLGE